MRHFLAGLGALVIVGSQSMLAQPMLFSEQTKTSNTALAARSGDRTRRVSANAALLGRAEVLDFNLFDDRHFLVHKKRISTDGTASIWRGEIEGPAGSEVTLVIDGDRITGSIRTSDGSFFRVSPEEDGTHSVSEVKASGAVIGDETVEPPDDSKEQEESVKESTAKNTAVSSPVTAFAAAKSTVDLLVVYTPEARAAAGSTANIVNRIQLAVAETNQGYVNSGIDMELRLVGTSEIAPSASQAANTTYLNQVTTNAAIGALRNQLGADMVSVWINGAGAGGGTVGIAWIQTRPASTFQYYAYSVVELNFAAGPYYSFSHELGHNLGGAHDRANASTPGAFPYAYGFQQQPGAFVDIMAYTGGCSGCSRINYFSNPDVFVNNYPTGVASTATNSADLRLTINSTRTFAELWRATVSAPTPVTPPPPVVTTYAPTVSSVSPSAGTGTGTVFTASFSDGNGASDIRTVHASIQSGSTANACYVSVDRASGAIQLRNNTDSGWITGIALGQASSLSNSQCTVNGMGASLTANGNGLALVLPVSFASSYSGTRDINLKADDLGGLTSNWQKAGTWTIPAVVIPPTRPSFSSLSPANGSGQSATFVANFIDPNGAVEIGRALILINSRLSSANGCYIYVYANTRQYYLLNAAGSGWVGPGGLGSTSLSNGNCTVGAGASATVSGTNLAVTIPIQFGASFVGSKTVFSNVADLSGVWGAWSTAGAFNVQ